MGFYDRDYSRDESGSVELGGHSTMVTKLVIINVALYVLDIFIGRGHWLMDVLGATPNSLVKPWLGWQLLTYGFAHSPVDKMHIVWNMFGLWVFGREVEAIYGRKEFLRIYLLAILLGGLFWTGRNCLTVQPALWDHVKLIGASGAVTAVILLFCIHFPRRTILLMFVLPVPAWVVGLLIIGLNLLGMQVDQNIAVDVHLVGAALAICYHRFGWNLGRWLPSGSLPRGWLRPKPKFRVHHPDPVSSDPDEEADQVLAKVNREGITSLTTRERRVLEEYSRRMRDKRR